MMSLHTLKVKTIVMGLYIEIIYAEIGRKKRRTPGGMRRSLVAVDDDRP